MEEKYPLAYVLVEDDEDDRLLIKLALQKAQRPLPIHEFTNGQELIDYLHQDSAVHQDNTYHWLIVMDVNMPVLDGMSALKYIRQQEHWQKIPILLFSTSSNNKVISEALQSGANGYIVKPDSMQGYKEIFDKFFAPWLQDHKKE